MAAANTRPSAEGGNCTLLYHQTIIPTQNITHAIEGSFTLPNANDLVIIRHNTLELWTLHADSGTAECIHSTPLFAAVYAAVAVPTSSATLVSGHHHRDSSTHSGAEGSVLDNDAVSLRRGGVTYLAVTSETGYLTLLRYQLREPPMPTRVSLASGAVLGNGDAQAATTVLVTTSLKGSFLKVSEICLGRSGARLTVPGARLAVDSAGEALFVTALMRNKVVVPLRRTGVSASGLALRGEADADDTIDDVCEEEDRSDNDMADDSDSSAANSNAVGGGRPNGGRRRKRRAPVANGVITLGSPIEALRHTIILSVCALDGFADSTVFAALEEGIVEMEEVQGSAEAKKSSGEAFLKLPGAGARKPRRKHLVVYAYSASLQQVQRTHLVHLPPTAHRLIAVPGAPCGPAGVLVCTDAEVIWYDLSSQQQSGMMAGGSGATAGVFKCFAPLPRRSDFVRTLYDPSIVCHATTRVVRDFFMLLQDEHGDVFRVLLPLAAVQKAYADLHAQQQQQRLGVAAAQPAVSVANPLAVHYFDTVPPCTAMALFRKGYLFAAAEAGPSHGLYKITRDGYKTEQEYIVRRIERTRGSAPAPAVKAEVRSEDRKRGRGADGADREDAKGAMSMPMPPPPQAMAMPPPAAPVALPARIIAVYQPHPRPQHMALIRSYPNTPAIAAFTTMVPGQGDEENDQQQKQQPQVQVNAVAGRGADSALVQARYGYATRRDGRFTLPAVFTSVIALPSASELQRIVHEQYEAVAAATKAEKLLQQQAGGHGGATGEAGRVRTLKQLAAMASSSIVGTDKVILSTRQGTAVFSVAEKVVQDTLSGFITAERTLSANTLKHGSGYVQVTPRGVHVLGASAGDAQAASRYTVSVTPTHWTHPHGKHVIAAATTPTTVLLSFGASGGIASFNFGLSGTQLEQCDVLPTFPTAQAVALLQPPASAVTGAVQSELNALLFNDSTAGISHDRLELAAVATAAREVYIVDPKKLREPLAKVNCTRTEEGGGGGEITSVLLTYLGGGGAGGVSIARSHRLQQRRLYCFIGHLDGMLTRCELDPVTISVIDTAELSCGSSPCQLIQGDGETVCYVQSGQHSWRCDIQDGVAKVVPWRFPVVQSSFSRFVAPGRTGATRGRQSTAEPDIKREKPNDEEHEEDESITLVSGDTRDELVVAVRDRELSLFAAQQTGGGASALEYSISSHSLPVAGRRIARHPTRPSYYIIAGTEHRGYGIDSVREQREARAAGLETSSIALDAPLRSLGKADHYVSTLQLYNESTGRLLPPYYFQDGDSVRSMAVGCFLAEFGKEPVVVVGAAVQYTHGSGCGDQASWTQGWLRTFRFKMTGGGIGGAPVLSLDPLHSTLIRPDTDPLPGETYIPDYPSALHICEDVGLLFVGLGKECGLRIYAWGQKQFLCKRRLPNVPGRIIALDTVFVKPPAGAAASATSAAMSTSGGSSGAGMYNAPDLYRSPSTRAREKQLLIVCATVDQSVFVASLQTSSRGHASLPSFLLQVARDAVPRSLTSMAVLDDNTIAVADRFGCVTFLRIPPTTRLRFSQPMEQLKEVEVAALERYMANDQILEEVASHQTGQLVTSLQAQRHDPSGGSDPALSVNTLFYSTALGAVGAYSPFVCEEDGALAGYLHSVLSSHMRLLLAPQSGHLAYTLQGGLTASPSPTLVHNVVEGDTLQLYRQASTSVFATAAKNVVEGEVERLSKAEAARRRVLGLPPRELPLIADLVAKHRALVTLPV